MNDSLKNFTGGEVKERTKWLEYFDTLIYTFWTTLGLNFFLMLNFYLETKKTIDAKEKETNDDNDKIDYSKLYNFFFLILYIAILITSLIRCFLAKRLYQIV